MTGPTSGERFLLGRAIVAFAVLPGTVAYLIPVLVAPARAPSSAWQWPGAIFLATGTVLLLWCVRDFYVAGKGTLAPWSPPEQLVQVGLYRWSRNPMYIAVLTVLIGWALWYGSLGLALYAVGIAGAFHLRVLFYEEPRLETSFGQDWLRYKGRVRRWF